jgi:hypothetical protein
MRYTQTDGKVARREDAPGAIWPLQAQSGTSYLLAERQDSFPWFVSQHAFFRQIGLDAVSLGQRRAKPVVAAGTESAEPAPHDAAPYENAILMREILALTDRRSFLSGTSPDLGDAELSGGLRVDPSGKNIYGYAWDKKRPLEPSSVICFLNDRAIFLSLANKDNFRWEGGKLIRSKRRNGFQIVAEPLKFGEGDRVDAYFVKYRRRLDQSPLEFRNGKLMTPSEIAEDDKMRELARISRTLSGRVGRRLARWYNRILAPFRCGRS